MAEVPALTRTWRDYLAEMLREDLDTSDLPPEAREVLLRALEKLSSENATGETELPALTEAEGLPPYLSFLSRYPSELRTRTLERLKAQGMLS